MVHRMPQRRGRALCTLLHVLPAIGIPAGPAYAETAESRDVEVASSAFAEGQRAFAAHDYLSAAHAFEASYLAIPHYDSLWNSAESWLELGEQAKAATRFAHYLQVSPKEAKDRAVAIETLHRLEPKLGRLSVMAEGLADVQIDNEPLTVAVVYVYPGAHSVRALDQGRRVEQVVKVEAGEVRTVVLERGQPVAAARPMSEALSPAMAVRPTSAKRAPLPRGAVYIGIGATVASGAFAIWSGIDTWQAAQNYNRTLGALESGLGKQTRTNILYGVTGGLGVLTAVTAIWLVSWESPTKSVGLAVSPSSIAAVGLF